MATWTCAVCTAAYSVGAPRCPQCSGTEHAEEGQDDMAKITRHGGLTSAADPEQQEESSPTPEAPGTSSPTSSAKEPTSPETSGSGRPKRARKTASPSEPGRTGGSTARPTGGAPETGTSATGSEEA